MRITSNGVEAVVAVRPVARGDRRWPASASSILAFGLEEGQPGGLRAGLGGHAGHGPGLAGPLAAGTDPGQEPGRRAAGGIADVVLVDVLAQGLAGHGHGTKGRAARAAPGDLAQDRVDSPGAGDVLDVVAGSTG